MDREVTLDRDNNRLVFLMSAPDQKYWELLWEDLLSFENISNGDKFVIRETSRVLRKGSLVVDAGCGIGATVYGLREAGYKASGLDYATETVEQIRQLVPDLDIRLGDVRSMPFECGELDGVWSLGVIEHFYDGFDPIICEAFRVLKDDGFLFLTVPTISSAKKMKAFFNLYCEFGESHRGRFFQFSFPSKHVENEVCKNGFEFIRSSGRSGAFGFAEDFPRFSKLILLNVNGRSLLSRVWWRVFDICVTPFSYHTKYYLFRKKTSSQTELSV